MNDQTMSVKLSPTTAASFAQNWSSKSGSSSQDLQQLFESEDQKMISFKFTGDLNELLNVPSPAEPPYTLQFHLGINQDGNLLPFVSHGAKDEANSHWSNAYTLVHTPSVNASGRYQAIINSSKNLPALIEIPVQRAKRYVDDWVAHTDFSNLFSYSFGGSTEWFKHFKVEMDDYSSLNKFFNDNPNSELYVHFAVETETIAPQRFKFRIVVDLQKPNPQTEDDLVLFERLNPCPPCCPGSQVC